jgi:hypothetical protein
MDQIDPPVAALGPSSPRAWFLPLPFALAPSSAAPEIQSPVCLLVPAVLRLAPRQPRWDWDMFRRW